MRVAVAGGATWTADLPTKVVQEGYAVDPTTTIFRNHDIAPDGQRFLMLKTAGSAATDVAPQIVVVEHFDEELKRVVPAK